MTGSIIYICILYTYVYVFQTRKLEDKTCLVSEVEWPEYSMYYPG